MITSEWPTDENPHYVPFVPRQVKHLRSAGVEVDIFPFRGWKKVRNYARTWRAARKRLKNGQYDLVHAQWGQSGLVVLPVSVPLVVTFRGSDLEGIPKPAGGGYTIKGRVLQSVSKMVAKVADEVIVVSESLARHLPDRSVHVIPSGVEFDVFKPIPMETARSELGLPLGGKLIFFGGNPNRPVKRAELARDAVQRMGEHTEVKILFPERIPHEKMPLYMNAADVVLLTSVHEGSPDVVKEALACNIPVVSTDVGDVARRLRGIDGCEIADGTVDAVCSALTRVLARTNRTDSRRKILDLDEAYLTQQVVNVYDLALKSRGSSFHSEPVN